MRKIFTTFNIVIVLIGFLIGTFICKYEDRNGILTVAAPTVDTTKPIKPMKQSSEISEKVNINTATKQELMELDGIGEAMSNKIIEYRRINGDFNMIEELMKIPGFGKERFERIKEDICV